MEAVATDGEANAYVTGFGASEPNELWGAPVAMRLTRFGSLGERRWTRRWESTSRRYPHAVGFDVAVAADGSAVYVAGAVMNDSTEVRRGRLWAYSPEGGLLWSVGTGRHVMTAVAASPSGPVAGGRGSLGAWDAEGGRLWIQPFEEPAEAHCDVLEDVAVGDQDEIYVIGSLDMTPTCGSVEGGAFEDADIVIQSRSSSGDLVWSTVLNDPGVTDNDWGFAVDASGPWILVAGRRDGSAWVARMSSSGEISWERWLRETTTMVGAVDVAPWDAVYVAISRGLDRFTVEDDLTWHRRLRRPAQGVATAPGRVLYVAAGGGFSVQDGDLWRMRP